VSADHRAAVREFPSRAAATQSYRALALTPGGGPSVGSIVSVGCDQDARAREDSEVADVASVLAEGEPLRTMLREGPPPMIMWITRLGEPGRDAGRLRRPTR